MLSDRVSPLLDLQIVYSVHVFLLRQLSIQS